MASRRISSLSLFRIRFPIGAIASVSHRLSGAVLVLTLPLIVECFVLSLGTAQDHALLRARLDHPLYQLALLLIGWAAIQHVLAGLRHLLMDVGVGVGLKRARQSAWLVLAGGGIGAALLLWSLLR